MKDCAKNVQTLSSAHRPLQETKPQNVSDRTCGCYENTWGVEPVDISEIGRTFTGGQLMSATSPKDRLENCELEFPPGFRWGSQQESRVNPKIAF